MYITHSNCLTVDTGGETKSFCAVRRYIQNYLYNYHYICFDYSFERENALIGINWLIDHKEKKNYNWDAKLQKDKKQL